MRHRILLRGIATAALAGACLHVGRDSAHAQAVQSCLVDLTTPSRLRVIAAVKDPITDTHAVQRNGVNVPVASAYPAPGTHYAAGHAWFVNDDPIVFLGRRYNRFALPRTLDPNEIQWVRPPSTRRPRPGTIGIPVFVGRAARESPPPIIYVPTRPGCEFQPYQISETIRAVRG